MSRPEKLDKKKLLQLVKLYRSAPGADDAVGPEIRRRGARARDELIQILDTMRTEDLGSVTAETIEELLALVFPSEESAAALERFQARYPATLRGSGDLLQLTAMRAKLSGLLNEAWEREHYALPPEEQDFHYVELLLASARAADRVVFLVHAANAALLSYWNAGHRNNQALRAESAAKMETFAREILAIPDLPAKSGDGVYTAHKVLGLLAVDRGDIEAAKHHLIESSKTPGSWMLNRMGPDFRLMLALTERGEYETVCAFLDNVKVFTKWPPCPTPKPKDKLLDRWKETIRAGGRPDISEWLVSNLPKRRQ